jgi:arsenite-transporting ATPase
MGGRVIVYTGKGGTGKSVISCATGLRMAELGYEALVISADPAHTLTDAYGVKVSDHPTRVFDRLWAVQMDSMKEVEKNYGAVQSYLASILSAKGVDETLAYEVASLPGMTFFLALLKVEELLGTDRYDALILDTIPSGEALRFLLFPKLISGISRKMLKLASPFSWVAKIFEPLLRMPTPDKEVFNAQAKLLDRLERLSKIVGDASTTSVRLVANPDLFCIRSLKRSFMISNLYGINVDLAIINKVLPEEAGGSYFDEWVSSQAKYIREAEVSFYPLPIKKLKLFESEIRGLSMLRRCAEELFGEEDPSQVYYDGRLFEASQDEGELMLKVKVPFADKDVCEVERIGDEVLVKVMTDVGEVVSVIPLPAVAYKMRLHRARFLKDELLIHLVSEEDEGRKGCD